MSKSCDGLLQDFVRCLLESDCVKVTVISVLGFETVYDYITTCECMKRVLTTTGRLQQRCLKRIPMHARRRGGP